MLRLDNICSTQKTVMDVGWAFARRGILDDDDDSGYWLDGHAYVCVRVVVVPYRFGFCIPIVCLTHIYSLDYSFVVTCMFETPMRASSSAANNTTVFMCMCFTCKRGIGRRIASISGSQFLMMFSRYFSRCFYPSIDPSGPHHF